jgi:hypothetical protein
MNAWSSRNGILERTGGQVSKAYIFERCYLSSCLKEKSCFKFGPNYLTNRGRLKFYFCRKWKLHSLTRVLVCLYSFITAHRSINSIWISSYSMLQICHSAMRGVGMPAHIYDIRLLKVNNQSFACNNVFYVYMLYTQLLTELGTSTKQPLAPAVLTEY